MLKVSYLYKVFIWSVSVFISYTAGNFTTVQNSENLVKSWSSSICCGIIQDVLVKLLSLPNVTHVCHPVALRRCVLNKYVHFERYVIAESFS